MSKKISYRRVIAGGSVSVEMFSYAAKLYDRSHLKRLAIVA